MSRKKKIIYLLISGLIILTIAGFAASVYLMLYLNKEDYYFKSYSEASHNNFARDNWPKQVSKNVTEIYAQSQYNVYNVWMRFEVERGDAEEMVSRLRKLSDEEIRELSIVRPWRVDWWFDGFAKQANHTAKDIDAEVYVDINGCETTHTARDAYIALVKNGNTGYYWCDGIKEQTSTSLVS